MDDFVPNLLQGTLPLRNLLLRLGEFFLLGLDLQLYCPHLCFRPCQFLFGPIGEFLLFIEFPDDEGEFLLRGVLVAYGHLLGLNYVGVGGDLSLEVFGLAVDEVGHEFVLAGGKGVESQRMLVLLEDAFLQHALEAVGVGGQLREPLEDGQALRPGMRGADGLEEGPVVVALVPEHPQCVLHEFGVGRTAVELCPLSVAVDGAEEDAEDVEEGLVASRLQCLPREGRCVGGVFQFAHDLEDLGDHLVLQGLRAFLGLLLGDGGVVVVGGPVDVGGSEVRVRLRGLVHVGASRVVHCQIIRELPALLNQTYLRTASEVTRWTAQEGITGRIAGLNTTSCQLVLLLGIQAFRSIKLMIYQNISKIMHQSLLSRYSSLMRTRILSVMVRQATQSLTPVKLVVEMIRMPVVTAMAIEVFCVCISLMISSRLKQQDRPSISIITYCQVSSAETYMNGYSHAEVHSRNRLIWLQIAQGEFVGSPRSNTATIPKRILGASLKAYSGEVHSMVMEPPMIAPKMMRQKQPCLPARDSQTMAKIIPPEAFQPQVRQKQSPTEVRSAASLRRSSCGLVGRKGMSLFLRRMKTRLQTKVTSMATKTNCTGVISSCLAMEMLMHNKTGPRRSSDTGENSISGSSANYLQSYS